MSVEVPRAELVGADPIDRGARAFVHGLRDLGWVDGRDIVIESRSAEGHPDRLPALLREVIAAPVDVIVGAGSAFALAARQATDKIPIVAVGPNLVALGLAGSLARPGGNVTGLTFTAGPAVDGKRLELLKHTVPNAKRVVLIRGRQPPGQPAWTAETSAAAQALGLALSFVVVNSSEDFDAAFADISRRRPDAIWCADSPVTLGNRARIMAFAARERLPAIARLRQFAEVGALMAYGPSLVEAERHAARYVAKILEGAKPGELPIEQPARLEFVINLKTAKALAIAIPKAVLLQADELIE